MCSNADLLSALVKMSAVMLLVSQYNMSRAVTPEAPADTRDMAEEAVYPPKMMPLKCAFKR